MAVRQRQAAPDRLAFWRRKRRDMSEAKWWVCCLVAIVPAISAAQQIADTSFRPVIARPEFSAGAGPLIVVDRGHNTFHVDEGHFTLFADVLRRDGFRARDSRLTFSTESLAGGIRILVIVNALADRDVDKWVLPTSAAFTSDEVAAVERWVRAGGSLLLVVDHMPFPGAAAALGRAFGVELMNGFAIVEADWDPLVFRRADGTLRSHPITNGRRPAERIGSAVTFVSGHAFRAMNQAVCPLLVFGRDVVSINPERAWMFTDATPRVPVTGWLQGAAIEHGRGRVAIFGEAAMFAAQLVGPKQNPTGYNSPAATENLQLLLNTVRWLAKVRGFDRTEACRSAARVP